MLMEVKFPEPSASGKGGWLIIKPLGQVIRRVIIRAKVGSKLLHLLLLMTVFSVKSQVGDCCPPAEYLAVRHYAKLSVLL
ncbi:hypothetical protein A5320_12285 [Rheinheimera sp. SA_1]|nr:hypothetical protein A5320_12285 [Rheinheimera sp. SA_1]